MLRLSGNLSIIMLKLKEFLRDNSNMFVRWILLGLLLPMLCQAAIWHAPGSHQCFEQWMAQATKQLNQHKGNKKMESRQSLSF